MGFRPVAVDEVALIHLRQRAAEWGSMLVRRAALLVTHRRSMSQHATSRSGNWCSAVRSAGER